MNTILRVKSHSLSVLIEEYSGYACSTIFTGLTATPEFLGYRVFAYRHENVKLSLWDMPGSYSSSSGAAEKVNERYFSYDHALLAKC